MENIILYATYLAVAVIVLIALTNIVTQVTKKIVAWDKFPTQVWCFVVAEALTILTLVIYCQIINVTMIWYYVVIAFIIGIIVCYAAMFGYDNLYKEIVETIARIKQIMTLKKDE